MIVLLGEHEMGRGIDGAPGKAAKVAPRPTRYPLASLDAGSLQAGGCRGQASYMIFLIESLHASEINGGTFPEFGALFHFDLGPFYALN